MTIEEASVNINNPDLITAIKSAIVCTNTKDTYSSGFRNGLRYVIALLTDEEPKYEDVPKQDDAIFLLKEQEEQIKKRDESLEKAREEIKWLRGMLKERNDNFDLYDTPIFGFHD